MAEAQLAEGVVPGLEPGEIPDPVRPQESPSGNSTEVQSGEGMDTSTIGGNPPAVVDGPSGNNPTVIPKATTHGEAMDEGESDPMVELQLHTDDSDNPYSELDNLSPIMTSIQRDAKCMVADDRLVDNTAYATFIQTAQCQWVVYEVPEGVTPQVSRTGRSLAEYPIHRSTPACFDYLLREVFQTGGFCPMPGCDMSYRGRMCADMSRWKGDFLAHWMANHTGKSAAIKCNDVGGCDTSKTFKSLTQIIKHWSTEHGLSQSKRRNSIAKKKDFWHRRRQFLSKQIAVFGGTCLPWHHEFRDSSKRDATVKIAPLKIVKVNPASFGCAAGTEVCSSGGPCL